MYIQHYLAQYELKNGIMFEMRWSEKVWPATFHDPEEGEESEPRFFLDGEEMNKLPKGLDGLVDRMRASARVVEDPNINDY